MLQSVNGCHQCATNGKFVVGMMEYLNYAIIKCKWWIAIIVANLTIGGNLHSCYVDISIEYIQINNPILDVYGGLVD
jgi:hypothetical protein